MTNFGRTPHELSNIAIVGRWAKAVSQRAPQGVDRTNGSAEPGPTALGPHRLQRQGAQAQQPFFGVLPSFVYK